MTVGAFRIVAHKTAETARGMPLTGLETADFFAQLTIFAVIDDERSTCDVNFVVERIVISCYRLVVEKDFEHQAWV